LLTCIRNASTLESQLKDITTVLAEELELQIINLREFITAFKNVHISRGLPLGFITTAMLAPFGKQSDRIKYSPLLHHLIIKIIYDEIWLPSRQVTHDLVVPIPPSLNKIDRIPTSPLPHFLIQSEIDKYISKGYTYSYAS